MKFVSIDVGIKNLSFCLFNKNENDSYYELLKWDNIDLTEKYEMTCIETIKNEICGKPAKFTKDSKCYCLKHSKQMNYLLPKSLQKLTSVSSPLAHLYPLKFNIDFLYKHKYFEGIPKLPNINIQLISEIFKKYKNKLSIQDKEQNRVDKVFTFN